MGAYDDLIPDGGKKSGGGYDDLIPKKGGGQPDSRIWGMEKGPPEKDYGFFGNALGFIAEPPAAKLSGFAARPISQVMGMAAAAKEGKPTAESGDPLGFQQDIQNRYTYEPKTPGGQFGMQLDPFALIGKLLHALGEGGKQMVAPPGSSIEREAAGRGVEEFIEQAPGVAGPKAAKAAPAAGKAMQDTGVGLMFSALKPTLKAHETGKALRGAKTILEEGTNVTERGAATLQARIDTLNNKVKTAIANSPAMVDKAKATPYVTEKIDEFLRQIDPMDDVAAIQRVHERFMDHPLLPKVTPAKTVESAILDEKGKPFTKDIPASGSNLFPVQLAQELKQGTNRQLGSKAYGEMKTADVEGQKTLTRFLKDQIAELVPEVRPLNARESNLLNALELKERRLMVAANKNPIGLGWLTLNPAKFALWMADRSELFKSLVARMLYSSGGAMKKAGPLSGPIGMDISSEAVNQPPQ